MAGRMYSHRPWMPGTARARSVAALDDRHRARAVTVGPPFTASCISAIRICDRSCDPQLATCQFLSVFPVFSVC